MAGLIELLEEAESEIRQLRRSNEILSAKVGVMESLLDVFHARPPEYLNKGCGPDVTSMLREKITEIQGNVAAPRESAAEEARRDEA